MPRSFVSGHMVRGRSSEIRHRNQLTVKAWEKVVQELGKVRCSVIIIFMSFVSVRQATVAWIEHPVSSLNKSRYIVFSGRTFTVIIISELCLYIIDEK